MNDFSSNDAADNQSVIHLKMRIYLSNIFCGLPFILPSLMVEVDFSTLSRFVSHVGLRTEGKDYLSAFLFIVSVTSFR